MDAELRRYLEQPAPRPPRKHRHDRQIWLIPPGAAISFGYIFGSAFADDRNSWPLGLALWGGVVCAVALLCWKSQSFTQAFLRSGTFTEGRVVSTKVELASEGRTLIVIFRAHLAGTGTGYRDAGERDALYRSELTDRWIVPTHVPFLKDAAFPMLVTPDRKHAKLYVNDEEIDATRA
jgi:hypothetical protein